MDEARKRDLERRIALHERLLANPKLNATAQLNIKDNLERLRKELAEEN